MTKRVAALILAAGLSSRMGELKPLLPLGDGNVLESTTACFLAAGITDIYVVIGHAASRIRDNYNDVGRVIFYTTRDTRRACLLRCKRACARWKMGSPLFL